MLCDIVLGMARKLPDINKLLIPTLVVLLVISAFLVGSLYTKVSLLEKDGVPIKSLQAGDQTAPELATADPYTPVQASELNIPAVTDNDHIRGAKDAKLTWIEYSDLECPFCQRIHPDLQKLLSEYDGQVRWVYRHFPIASLHSKAPKEAEAAECAAELGGNDAFWKFVDRLFEVTPANDGLDLKQLPQIAADVGLNRSAFQTCLDSGKYADRVQADLDGGSGAGVSGTPGNFLLDDKGNAWIISGAQPYNVIKAVVDQALAL